MRVQLAVIARSSGEPYLDACLSIMRPSFDGVAVQYDEGLPIRDFAAARNGLIRSAEADGFDWMVMLDADECMYPDDLARLRRRMDGPVDVIALPRVELVNDMGHWDPTEYPDYQARVFRLGRGYHYRHRVHEKLYAKGAARSELEKSGTERSDDTPIYHYGRTKSAADVLAKFAEWETIEAGSTPLGALRTGGPMLWPGARAFDHPHPLDGTGRAGDWAQFGRLYHRPGDVIGSLNEHLPLVEDLATGPGPLLGVGLETRDIARFLAESGQVVVVVDEDAAAIDMARGMESCRSLTYVSGGPSAALPVIEGPLFARAFSVGTLQRLDDAAILRSVTAQLEAAEVVVASAPSDRHPEMPPSRGRLMSPEQWRAVLAPAGAVEVAYYGVRPLPLRDAISRKVSGRLRQDSLHVRATVTRDSRVPAPGDGHGAG